MIHHFNHFKPYDSVPFILGMKYPMAYKAPCDLPLPVSETSRPITHFPLVHCVPASLTFL